MLAYLTKQVKERALVLDRFLTLCEVYDDASANPGAALHQELVERCALGANLTEEKVFRHCSVVTRLYGVYESFAESVLSFWLARLPRYQAFTTLSPSFRNAYRCGIARIIHNADKRQYRHIVIDNVLEKYLVSLRGESPWELVGDALTAHENNLRRSEFEQLFHAAGLDGVWAYLEKNELLARLSTDADKSLEQMILELVIFRNEAAHGAPDDILGIDTLRQWIVFVNAFCDALADFLTHRIVREEAAYHPQTVYGTVTETFKNRIAVAKCHCGTLNVGDYLYFLRATDCTYARIESLQVEGVNQQSVTIPRPDFEVGMQTSIEVPKKAKLVKLDQQPQ